MGLRPKVRTVDRLDFELNIVPIIDCFVILITFMLAAGVYVSIGILEVGVSEKDGIPVAQEKPALEIKVEIKQNNTLALTISGKAKQSLSISPKNKKWDFQKLGVELSQVKSKWSDIGTVTLYSHWEVPYQNVIEGMETIKRTHPEVLLGF